MDITSKDQLDKLIAEGPVFIDFWSKRCRPCLMIAPVIKDAAKELEGEVAVVKVDVDEHGDIANEYKISSIPTLVLKVDSETKFQAAGLMTKNQILETVRSHL